MMKDYFIIFPHAGAIRSSYATVERCLSRCCEIIWVDYSTHIPRQGEIDFGRFIGSIQQYLNSVIKRKNAGIILFGHSMGSSVLQAVEKQLSECYYVNLVIHSDGDVLSHIASLDLKNKNREEQKRILDENYDIPAEVRNNEELSTYFEELLLRDLLVLDTIPEYVGRSGVPQGAPDVSHLVFLSNIFNFEEQASKWKKEYGYPDAVYFRIDGGHYSILENFQNVCDQLVPYIN